MGTRGDMCPKCGAKSNVTWPDGPTHMRMKICSSCAAPRPAYSSAPTASSSGNSRSGSLAKGTVRLLLLPVAILLAPILIPAKWIHEYFYEFEEIIKRTAIAVTLTVILFFVGAEVEGLIGTLLILASPYPILALLLGPLIVALYDFVF